MILSVLLSTPFSLVSLILWASVRIVCLGALAWWELIMTFIGVCLGIFSKIMVWALAVLILPLRPFIALYREMKLAEQLREMKAQLENFSSENKELEQCLLLAVKDANLVKKIFHEIEDEHEKAVAKISLLEFEIQELKAQKKGVWEMRGGISSSRNSECKDGAVSLPALMVCRQRLSEDEGKERRGFQRVAEKSLEKQRVVAFQRSVFSVALSFLVGWIVWTAEDPCMPLVAALFAVVGMSLNSLICFFSTIKNKAASGAVVLLSINCFMLGTLSIPTLRSVAVMWGPSTMRSADWFFCRIGFYS